MNRLSLGERTAHSANEDDIHSLASSISTCISVREGYDRWAPIYDRSPNPVLALEERHLKNMLPDLAGENILDLACGTGRWIPRLLARGARRVIGLDLSAAMLRVAGDKAGIRERLILGDCKQLPFASGVFDFALCSFALNHIPNLDMVACELARTVKGQGRILITEMHPNAYAQGWRPGFRDQRGAAQIETVGRSAENVVSCFRANGFASLKLSDLFFGEPERTIFLEAQKGDTFDSACRVPVIQVYHFTNFNGYERVGDRGQRCADCSD